MQEHIRAGRPTGGFRKTCFTETNNQGVRGCFLITIHYLLKPNIARAARRAPGSLRYDLRETKKNK